jgi:glycosyltransferase involved in cell wall biosynthesis
VQQKVLCFFPHNLYPPRSGAHKRGLEMLSGLKEIGCEATLLSSSLSAEPQWQTECIQSLKAHWVRDVRVYEPSSLEYQFIKRLEGLHGRLGRRLLVNSRLRTPPGMRRWFERMLHEISPDVVLMSYAHWDGLINHRRFRSLLRIIDILDLVTLNMQMRQALDRCLPSPPISADTVEDHVLQEDFFEKLRLTVDPTEFRIYDEYNYTIAISPQEADIVKRNTGRTRVQLIPMTHEPAHLPNTYAGPALFPTGPNLFNIQGYLYFVRRVLPGIQSKARDFSLRVTGYCCEMVRPAEGILLSGFVPDLKEVYQSARFVVCPVFGGTGQQIKIVEALAHGVPVIALRSVAQGSPIRHGVNGLIANSAEEFSEHVLQLWFDRELCGELGQAGRETIASEFSQARLLGELARILDS